jgi:hypothetical protein
MNGMNWRLGDSTFELHESGGSYMRFFSQAEVDADPILIVDQGIAMDGGYMFSVCSGCPPSFTFGYYSRVDEAYGGKNIPDHPYSDYYLGRFATAAEAVVHKHIMYLTAAEAAQVIAGCQRLLRTVLPTNR